MAYLRIFIASPGDLSEERDIVSLVVVPELRRIFGDEEIFGRDGRIDLEAIRWETHSWPDVGEDAQDVINRQIGDFDVLVGMMWKRFGTPTGRADSGTGEEFQRAYDYYKKYGRPRIMFYFRTSPFYTTDPGEWEQFSRVLSFRQQLVELGVRFTEYRDPLEFERYVREHLVRQIFRLYRPEPKVEAVEQLAAPDLSESPERARRRSLRVFITYTREDLIVAEGIYDSLKTAGFDPWIDVQDLLPGEQWQLRIREEIRSSGAVLVLLSNNSITKRGFVQQEMKYILDLQEELPAGRLFLLPIRLEQVEPPAAFRDYHWLDYFTEDGKDKLIEALDRILVQSGTKLPANTGLKRTPNGAA